MAELAMLRLSLIHPSYGKCKVYFYPTRAEPGVKGRRLTSDNLRSNTFMKWSHPKVSAAVGKRRLESRQHCGLRELCPP